MKALKNLLSLAFKKTKKYLSPLIIISIVTVAGFTITSQAKDNGDDTYYTNFQSKIDKAMGQDPNLTTQYSNPSLSSSMFNVNGPLQVSINWSDVYGPMLETHYANLLSDTNAIAIEGNLGSMQNRINVTLGHVFSPKNRIKITAERLAQKQTFDFYSGSIDEWVSQYAGGAELQHLIGGGFFNNISAGGYYARSGSKDLDPIIYTDTTGSEWINYRHIAGANSTGGHVSLGLKPWKTGMVTVTSYYDSVNYNTEYSDVSAEDSSSLGYGVALEQYIASTLKATAEYSHRALYDTIEGGIQWFHNIRHNKAAIGMSLGYTHNNYNDTTGDTNSENMYTVGLQYYFMPIRNNFTLPTFNFQSLTAWASEPAVRMEKVMATADQKKEGLSLQWQNPNLSHQPGIDTSHESITWSNTAKSNIPNDTISYQLIVKETNSGTIVYNKSFISESSTIVPNLSPGINYTAQVKATSSISHQVATSNLDVFTTDGSELVYDYAPVINETGKTEQSVTLSWTGPNRYDNHSNVTYTLTLINTDPDKNDTKHTYNVPSNRSGPDDSPIIFTTGSNGGDNLLPGSTYKISMQVQDHGTTQDKIDVTNNEGPNQNSCSTGGESKTLTWGNDPVSIEEVDVSGSGDNRVFTYDFKWDPATLTPPVNGENIKYHYKINAHYERGGGLSDDITTEGNMTQESSIEHPQSMSIQRKINYEVVEDWGDYGHLTYVSLKVYAIDNGSGGYSSTDTASTSIPVKN
jgi:hypothetical protein